MPMHCTAKANCHRFWVRHFWRSIQTIAYRFSLLFTKSFLWFCNCGHFHIEATHLCMFRSTVGLFQCFFRVRVKLIRISRKAHAIYCVTLSVKWFDSRQHSLCYVIPWEVFHRKNGEIQHFMLFGEKTLHTNDTATCIRTHAYLNCFVCPSIRQFTLYISTGPHKIQCAIERKSDRFSFVIRMSVFYGQHNFFSHLTDNCTL